MYVLPGTALVPSNTRNSTRSWYLLLVATFYALVLHFNRWPGIGIRHWSTGTWNEVTSKLLLSFCRNSYNLASGYPDTGQLVPGEPWYSEHLVLYCTYTPLTQRYGCHSFFLIDFAKKSWTLSQHKVQFIACLHKSRPSKTQVLRPARVWPVHTGTLYFLRKCEQLQLWSMQTPKVPKYWQKFN